MNFNFHQSIQRLWRSIEMFVSLKLTHVFLCSLVKQKQVHCPGYEANVLFKAYLLDMNGQDKLQHIED